MLPGSEEEGGVEEHGGRRGPLRRKRKTGMGRGEEFAKKSSPLLFWLGVICDIIITFKIPYTIHRKNGIERLWEEF